MPRKVEAPTEHRQGEEVTLRHPGYGQVTVFKTSGDFALYGSNIIHPNTISIRIHTSELQRRYSHDRYHHTNVPFVELRLSLAQWAEMISSIGNGVGTPCTIVSRDGVSLPEIPYENRAKEFDREGQETIDAVVSELEALRADVAANTAGTTKAKQAALLERVNRAIRSLGSSLPFIRESFREHMEHEKSRAAIEINAMAHEARLNYGHAAIASGEPVKLIPDRRDDDER